MRSFKKAVAVGAVITLLGSTTAVYVSKNDQIQDKINKLYNIAEGYKNKLTTSEGKVDDAQTELNAKKKILADLQTLLGAEGTSYDQLVAGINKKAKTMADTEFQNLINDMVETMHLPTTDAEGNPITYDANKLAEEIMAYKDEIDALNDYVNNYANYNNSEAYQNMTLLQKLQSMINQLTQASDDAQAQLTLAEAKIVKLGHCPKDEGALTNGTCAICGTHYDGAGTGSDITTDEGDGKGGEQPVNPPAQEQQPVTPPTQNPTPSDTVDYSAERAEEQALIDDLATKQATFETAIDSYSILANRKTELLAGTYRVQYVSGKGYALIRVSDEAIGATNANWSGVATKNTAYLEAKQALATWQEAHPEYMAWKAQQ